MEADDTPLYNLSELVKEEPLGALGLFKSSLVNFKALAKLEQSDLTSHGLLIEDIKQLMHSLPEGTEGKQAYNMMADCSHEIRSPLTFLKGYWQMLEQLGEKFPPQCYFETPEGGTETFIDRAARMMDIFNVANRFMIAYSIDLPELYRKYLADPNEAIPKDLTADNIIALTVKKFAQYLEGYLNPIKEKFADNPTEDINILGYRRDVIRGLENSMGVAKYLLGDYTGDYLLTKSPIAVEDCLETQKLDTAMEIPSLLTQKQRFGKQLDIPITWACDVRILNVDPILFKMIWKNLFENVVKYADCKANLTISAVDHQLQFALKDQGIGFNPAIANQIFDRGYRAVSTKNRVGSGIGLHICKKIVEAHGGKMWAESLGEGQGSTFYFTLPLTA